MILDIFYRIFIINAIQDDADIWQEITFFSDTWSVFEAVAHHFMIVKKRKGRSFRQIYTEMNGAKGGKLPWQRGACAMRSFRILVTAKPSGAFIWAGCPEMRRCPMIRRLWRKEQLMLPCTTAFAGKRVFRTNRQQKPEKSAVKKRRKRKWT